MENKNLYQKLKQVQKDRKAILNKKNELELQRKKELEEVTKPIKEKYDPIIAELNKKSNEKKEEFYYIAKLYHNYGSFSAYDIVHVLAALITYIEGEKYVVYKNPYGYESCLIIKEDVYQKYVVIHGGMFDMLYENNDIIILSEDSSTHIEFYDWIGKPCRKFGKFDYLYEFVNRLIQYQFEHDANPEKNMGISNAIEPEDLLKFMYHFIETHPNLAKKNQEKRDQMFMKDMETEILRRYKK